jgi:ferric iron reductase protein FhuF
VTPPGTVAPDRLAAAIGRAGAGNPLLGIGTGTGTPAASLVADPGAARELVDAVDAWLGHPERRVAASLTVLGYAARLVGPTVALLLRDGIVLDADPARVHYAYAPGRGFTLTMPRPAGWAAPRAALPDGWGGTVVDGHLGPVIAAVRAVVPVAAGLLWGNVASGLTGALAALAADGTVPLAECHGIGLSLLGYGPLEGSGRLDVRAGRLRFRRRSCCLFYRLDGGGTCGDCPLSPRGTRRP